MWITINASDFPQPFDKLNFIGREMIHLKLLSNLNIRHTLVGSKIVDHSDVKKKKKNHSDVFGASPVGAAPTTSSFSAFFLTPGFNRLGIDNCKTRQETFKFWGLVHLIPESKVHGAHMGPVGPRWAPWTLLSGMLCYILVPVYGTDMTWQLIFTSAWW